MAKPNHRKAIADAVKSKKNADGLVKVYPVEPVGESMVPNVAATVQLVDVEMAEELLAYQPPAFTLFESGNPMPEQKAMRDSASEQAWRVSNPKEAPDETSAMSPPFDSKPQEG